MLTGFALSASACQTAQRPASLLPARSAPTLTSSAPAPAPVQQQATPATPQIPTPKPTQLPVEPAIEAKPATPSAATPSTQAPPTTPSSDPIGDLIAHVEKDFQAGLDAYNLGHIEVAKQDFDNAFNALLESKLDVLSDDRLEKEFDSIVDRVNHLDLGSMGESDSDAQKSEPAPIDETNGITPSADAKVIAKAEAEIKSTHSDLPLMMTDQVAGFINYFSNRGRGTFERAFARSGRYHDMMVSILRQEGVPQDLIYLAQAESGFHPLAVSRAGARGIWQFMGSRARGYGLQHSLWVDDRQDPEKSTRAAAHHLKDLYAQFGDWYLAMAAYNSGPGTVQAAVKRTGYADFWELYRRNVLPKETRNYVPIILAVTIMAKNLSQYGFDDVNMDSPVAFDSVTIDYPVDLRLVADCVNSTPAQLQELNPSLLRLTTPKEGTFQLHLPVGTRDDYQTAISAIPSDMRLWWRYHKVLPGDTLASVARSYRVTANSIAGENQLEGNELEADTRLIIPVPPGKYAVSDAMTYSRRITRYKVHMGDTVETVAENLGVPAQMVRRWNGLRNGDSLRGRKVLAVHLPVTPGSEGSSTVSKSTGHTSANAINNKKKTVQAATTKPARAKAEDGRDSEQASVLRHKVKSGETLYSIATSYNTTVAALKRYNGDIAVLRPGMILIVQQSR
jgi:membrane-bound lytic murein transglycosylase D